MEFRTFLDSPPGTFFGGSNLRKRVKIARNRVAVLEAELDPEAIRVKLSAFTNIIGRYMSEFSDKLDLEHRGTQRRLDIRNLTVGTDTPKVPSRCSALEARKSGLATTSWHITVARHGRRGQDDSRIARAHVSGGYGNRAKGGR